jgi:integrase
VVITTHQFRRGLAHRWVQAGGADDLLMHVAGWRDPRMPSRYRAEARSELAIEAYARIVG